MRWVAAPQRTHRGLDPHDRLRSAWSDRLSALLQFVREPRQVQEPQLDQVTSLVPVGVQADDLARARLEPDIDGGSWLEACQDRSVDLERGLAAALGERQAYGFGEDTTIGRLMPDIGASAVMTTASSAGETIGPPAA